MKLCTVDISRTLKENENSVQTEQTAGQCCSLLCFICFNVIASQWDLFHFVNGTCICEKKILS